MASRDLFYVIKGDSSHFVKENRQARGSVKGLGNEMEETGTKAVAMGNIAAQAFQAIFQQGQRAVSAVIRTGAQFDQQMSRVGAISQATDQQLETMTATARELGSTTQFSAIQAGEGMQFLAQAGFSANETVEAMPGLLDVASAGQMKLARTSDIVSNVLGAFNMEASQTGEVGDILTATFTSSNVDLEMLGQTMSEIAPVSNALGISLEETAAATGLLGNQGIQASKAGTGLRAIMSRLASPTAEVKQVMNDLNLEVTNQQGEMRSLSDIIGQIETAFADMSKQQRAAAAETLAGREAISALSALVGAGSEKLRTFTKDLQQSAGTAQQVAEQNLDNLQGDWQIFQSAVTEGSLVIFDSLRDTLRAGLQSATDAVQDLAEGYQLIVANSDKLLPMLKGIGTVLGTAALAWAAYTAVVNRAAIATAAATSGLSLLITAVAAIGGVVATQEDALDGLSLILQGLGELFSIVFTNFPQVAKDSLLVLWEVWKSTFTSMFQFFNTIFDTITGSFTKFVQAIKQIITGDFAGAWDTVKSIGTDAANNFTENFKGIFDGVQQAIDNLGDNTDFSPATSKMREGGRLLAKGIKQGFTFEATGGQGSGGGLSPEMRQQGIEGARQTQEVEGQTFGTMQQGESAEVAQSKKEIEQMRVKQSKLKDLEKQRDKMHKKQLRQEKRERKAKERNLQMLGRQIAMQIQHAESVEEAAKATIKVLINEAIAFAIRGLFASAPPFVAAVGIPVVTAIVQKAMSSLLNFRKGGIVPGEDARDGGLVQGRSHEQGGVAARAGGRAMELEGGEAIINKQATKEFKPVLSAINSSTGGRKFQEGGIVDNFAGTTVDRTQRSTDQNIAQAVREGIESADIKTDFNMYEHKAKKKNLDNREKEIGN